MTDWLSGIGSVLSGAGSIFDIFNSNDTAQNQLDQEKQHQDFLDKLAVANRTDARGNQLVYDPKTNTFKTVLTPASKQLVNASDTEELQRLMHDLPSQRQGRDVNATSRSKENQTADDLLNQINTFHKITPEELRGEMATLGARGIKEGYDKVSGDVSAQALRSGTSGAGLLDQLSRSYARDLGTNNMQADLQSKTSAAGVNNANLGPLFDEYNMMRSRASNVGDVPYAPENVSQGFDGILGSAAGQAGNLSNAANSATNVGTAGVLKSQLNAGQDLGLNVSDLLAGIGTLLPSKSTGTVPSGNASQASRNGF